MLKYALLFQLLLQNLFQDYDFCPTCTSLSNGVFLSALSTSPAADGDCKRWEAKRDGKKKIKPEEGTEIPPPLAHFDLLYRTIYIKPKHHVYIFFSASLSLSPLLLFSVGSPLLSPPSSPRCVFSLSSGIRLHAQALWITELQETVSKNCSIFFNYFFFFHRAFSFSISQSAERDGRLDMMLQFLSWNSLCEMMDQLLLHY